MSDGELRSNWKSTLVRYVAGPLLAVVVMAALVTWNLTHRDTPWGRSEPISQQFQTQPEGHDWLPYTDSRLHAALAEGKIVVVNFVAKWNLESAQNRILLCQSPAMEELARTGRVALLLADYTDQQPAITVALRRLDRRQIPVVAIYAPDEEHPQILDGRIALTDVLSAIGMSKD